MRRVETEIIAELLKDSRRSHRELAKAIRVSQPTVSRLLQKLENGGLVKEYTIIPDFPSVGFSIMAVSFFKFSRYPSEEKLKEARETAMQFRKTTNPAVLMVMSGMGMGFDRMVITLHKDYPSYAQYMQEVKRLVQSEYSDVKAFDSFIINLCDKTHFLPLTLAALSKHVKNGMNGDACQPDLGYNIRDGKS